MRDVVTMMKRKHVGSRVEGQRDGDNEGEGDWAPCSPGVTSRCLSGQSPQAISARQGAPFSTGQPECFSKSPDNSPLMLGTREWLLFVSSQSLHILL